MEDNKIEKYFQDLIVKKSFNYDKIIKSIDIVQKYVMRKKLIIVGGQSIDYALRIRGNPGLYDEDAIPDIDIISDTHFEDVYAIALLLKRANIIGISVINALHPTTMKVRVDFQEVCDITYIPTQILSVVPTLFYKGYRISHPFYQYVDQHRALTYPLENAPFETVSNRMEKDMTRYDLLYEYYPLNTRGYTTSKEGGQIEIGEPATIRIDIINNQCISGFAALNYWLGEARKLGFKQKFDFGSTTFNGEFQYTLPVESNGLTLYSDDIQDLAGLLGIKESDASFYTRFLDKFPRKMVVKNKYEIFDNNQKLASHMFENARNKIYIANIQSIMFYLIANYVFVMRVNRESDRKFYVFYKAYMTCKVLFIWVSSEFVNPSTSKKRKEQLANFMPGIDTYGENNVNAALALRMNNFLVKNGDLPKTEKLKYKQPYNVFDHDMQYNKIPRKYMEFDKSDSEAFAIGCTPMKHFLDIKNEITGL
jgi:hypothetical protein